MKAGIVILGSMDIGDWVFLWGVVVLCYIVRGSSMRGPYLLDDSSCTFPVVIIKKGLQTFLCPWHHNGEEHCSLEEFGSGWRHFFCNLYLSNVPLQVSTWPFGLGWENQSNLWLK